MSLNYTAHYMFEHKDSDKRPEGEKYGQGVCPIEVDHVPTTPDDFKEIARTIGLAGKYSKVSVVRLLPAKDFHTTEDTGEVIEGVVLD